jgi:hypothetical protein
MFHYSLSSFQGARLKDINVLPRNVSKEAIALSKLTTSETQLSIVYPDIIVSG